MASCRHTRRESDENTVRVIKKIKEMMKHAMIWVSDFTLNQDLGAYISMRIRSWMARIL